MKTTMTVHGVQERLVQEQEPHPTDETGWVTVNKGTVWVIDARNDEERAMVHYEQDEQPDFKVGDTIEVTAE